MSISDALKDLPCRNKDHFSRLNVETQNRSNTGRKSTYLTTKDIPPEQIIVTDRENILLRFLHQQWDKKTNAMKKRQGQTGSQDEPVEKKAKLEPNLTAISPHPSSSSQISGRGQGSAGYPMSVGLGVGGGRGVVASSSNNTNNTPVNTRNISQSTTNNTHNNSRSPGSGAAGGGARSSVLYFN